MSMLSGFLLVFLSLKQIGKINFIVFQRNISFPFFKKIFLFILFLFKKIFLGLHPWHMEVPRLGVKSEHHSHSNVGSELHL